MRTFFMCLLAMCMFWFMFCFLFVFLKKVYSDLLPIFNQIAYFPIAVFYELFYIFWSFFVY